MATSLLSVRDRLSNRLRWALARLQRQPRRRLVLRGLFIVAMAPVVAVWGLLLVAAVFIRPS